MQLEEPVKEKSRCSQQMKESETTKDYQIKQGHKVLRFHFKAEHN